MKKRFFHCQNTESKSRRGLAPGTDKKLSVLQSRIFGFSFLNFRRPSGCFPSTLAVLLLTLAVFSPSTDSLTPRVYLQKVLNIVSGGDLIRGSRELYRLSRLRAYKSRRPQIKYTLGMVFTEMELYHLASVQFIYAVKYGNREYRRKALDKLGRILQYLGDDGLFFYVISLTDLRDFPIPQRDKYYFFKGAGLFKKKNYRASRVYFSKIKHNSSFYNRAQYHIGLSYAEENRVRSAERIFRNLSLTRRRVTDTVRVAALVGLARTLYQAGRFQESIKTYRSVPRDTPYWHDVLLESGWAYLMTSRFRSALSNFQTLHSPFYKDYYHPESLILRAYVYLLICRYYEMEKVLDLFNGLYLSTLRVVNRNLRAGNNYKLYFNEVTAAQRAKKSGRVSGPAPLPSVVLSRVMKSEKFKRHLRYLEKLKEERSRLKALPSSWVNSKVGRNADYILKARSETVKRLAGKEVKSIFQAVRDDIKRLSLSEQYLRYDMLRGKREFLKKKIAKKYADIPQIDESAGRDYYIQNGYDYWPFQGEHWVDELGNYHYVGSHSCR